MLIMTYLKMNAFFLFVKIVRVIFGLIQAVPVYFVSHKGVTTA